MLVDEFGGVSMRGWLAGLPVWADRSRGHVLGLAKKKSEKCAFLNWKFSMCVCSLLEEPLHCSGTCKCSSKQGVMLSHRAVLVQSVSTWLGHFMVLLVEEHNNLLLLYKAWARWTRISLKNNVWPEKNNRWDWDINLKAAWLCDLGTLHSRVFFLNIGLESSCSSFRLGLVVVVFFWVVFFFFFWFNHLSLAFLKMISSFSASHCSRVEETSDVPCNGTRINPGRQWEVLKCWIDTANRAGLKCIWVYLSKKSLGICSCIWLGIYFLGSEICFKACVSLTHFGGDAVISSKQTMLGSRQGLMSKGWSTDLFHVYCSGCDPVVEPGVCLPCICGWSRGFISLTEHCLSNPGTGVQF